MAPTSSSKFSSGSRSGSGRALLETLQDFVTGSTTTTTPGPSPPNKDSNPVPPSASGGLRDLSSYHQYLGQLLHNDSFNLGRGGRYNNSNNHSYSNNHIYSNATTSHLDILSVSNTTSYLNMTTSFGEDSDTDMAVWVAIRLVLIASVLICICLLAVGSYKLQNRCTPCRNSRHYKSTLLL